MNWISVEKELPTDGKDVMTWGLCGLTLARYDAKNEVWRNSFTANFVRWPITHWQPLPPPPNDAILTDSETVEEASLRG